MRRVEIWTVYGDHLVFYNVELAGPSEHEKFFCVRREDRIDYIPAYDIKRVQVTDNNRDRRCHTDYKSEKQKKPRGQNKQHYRR